MAVGLTYDLVCIECGTSLKTGLRPGEVTPDDGRRLTQTLLRGCPACLENGIKSNFTVRLDLSRLQSSVHRGADSLVDRTASGVWRWHKLLPVNPRYHVSLDEGGTPLVRLSRFGRRIGRAMSLVGVVILSLWLLVQLGIL